MSDSVTASLAKGVPLEEHITESDILIGKDVLELLTGAMYVEPLSIYREYTQNSCDAIDQARLVSASPAKGPGKIDILVDAGARSVRIRDDGIGVPAKDFV